MALEDVNSKVLSSFSFSKSAVINSLGWLLVGIVVIGICAGIVFYYYNKKKWSKNIEANENVNGFFQRTYNDTARTIKIGKGGFEVLYLKKLKTWKLSYGGRVGKKTYSFYVGPDGYWYNGVVKADILYMDKTGGLVPVVTTNPTMRAQYTALEKQIDSLHAEKKDWWAQYGNWVLTIGFVLIIGVIAWLIYREMHSTMSAIAGVADQMKLLAESLNKLTVNLNGAQPSGPAA